MGMTAKSEIKKNSLSLREELRMGLGFWWNLDAVSHRMPLIPGRIRNYICQKNDEGIKARVLL